MEITISHNLGTTEAVKRIDNFLSELMKKDFSDKKVEIKDPEKLWRIGNLMIFSFKVKQGFKRAKIEGSIRVEEKKAVLNIQPSNPIVRTLVDEDKLKKVVETKARELLS